MAKISGAWRRLMRRDNRERGFVEAGVATAGAVLVVGALVGNGVASTVLDMSDGQTWLPDEDGRIVQINPATGQPERRLVVGGPGSELDVAQRTEFQPGSGDDDVRLQLCARRQPDAAGGELVDGVGDDIDPAGSQHVEEIAIRHGAQPFIPGVVAGREMPQIHFCAQLAFQQVQQVLSDPFRLAAGKAVEVLAKQHVLPAGHTVGQR